MYDLMQLGSLIENGHQDYVEELEALAEMGGVL
jgi:hypothetical protein